MSIQKSKRNYGIDLLRMVSMLMVAVLHVLGKGGVLNGYPALSGGYELAWFLEIAAYCAVNCYGLISGYVGVNNRFRYAGILSLWLQVVFYSVGINVLFYFLSPGSIDLKGILKSFFPALSQYYWYYTAYFCMAFFIPFFNHLLHTLSRRQMKLLLTSMVFLFCVLQTLAKTPSFPLSGDAFYIKSGYSPVWLSVLYLIGGYIRKYNVMQSIAGWRSFVFYGGCVSLTWFFKYVIEYYTNATIGSPKGGSWFVSYVSPTILLASVFLLVGFSQLNVGKIAGKLIGFFSPLAFSVYLIHVHPLVWNKVIAGHFAFLTQWPTWQMGIAVVVSALALYIGLSLVDLFRFYLFQLLHVRQFCSWLERIIKRIAGKILRLDQPKPQTEE